MATKCTTYDVVPEGGELVKRSALEHWFDIACVNCEWIIGTDVHPNKVGNRMKAILDAEAKKNGTYGKTYQERLNQSPAFDSSRFGSQLPSKESQDLNHLPGGATYLDESQPVDVYVALNHTVEATPD
jgi:hypothetical protein